MKNLFLASILLFAFTSCQREVEESISNNSKIAISAIKRDTKKQTSRIGVGDDTSLDPPAPGGDVVINCHTSYSLNMGNSCVSVGGSLYRVSWLDVKIAGENYSERMYTSTKVASCSCSN